MLRGCSKDAQRMLEGCSEDARRMLRGCSKDAQRMLRGCSKDARRMLRGWPWGAVLSRGGRSPAAFAGHSVGPVITGALRDSSVPRPRQCPRDGLFVLPCRYDSLYEERTKDHTASASWQTVLGPPYGRAPASAVGRSCSHQCDGKDHSLDANTQTAHGTSYSYEHFFLG
jgi:hypothetical protein